MSDEPPIVGEADARPAGKPGECFYCKQAVGERHRPECVLWERMVTVRMVAEYTVAVPHSWTKEDVEFARNDSSWCANNGIDELQAAAEAAGCGCHLIHYEFVGEVQ